MFLHVFVNTYLHTSTHAFIRLHTSKKCLHMHAPPKGWDIKDIPRGEVGNQSAAFREIRELGQIRTVKIFYLQYEHVCMCL